MVFIVVPAYNEAKNIGRVIRGLFEHGWNKVVVVDDGSSDETATAARAAGATVLCHEINRGQGAALQTGNDYCLSAGAQMIVHFDGDGQFNPADISLAVKKMQQDGYDIIFGSRFLGKYSNLPWTKKNLILPIGKLVNRLLTGTNLSDAHNGFRIMNRQAAKKINITRDGMAHNSEIVVETNKLGLFFAECPVEVIYYEYGQGVGGGFKIIWDIILKKINI